jgi:hypothetical protein
MLRATGGVVAIEIEGVAPAVVEGFLTSLTQASAALSAIPARLEAARVHDTAFGKLVDAAKVRDAYHERLPATGQNITEACELIAHFTAQFTGAPDPMAADPVATDPAPSDSPPAETESSETITAETDPDAEDETAESILLAPLPPRPAPLDQTDPVPAETVPLQDAPPEAALSAAVSDSEPDPRPDSDPAPDPAPPFLPSQRDGQTSEG